MIYGARPVAIFLPKFENWCSKSDKIYAKNNAEHNTLIVTIKNSGSLWLAGAHEGQLIFTSKNGIANVYGSSGLYILLLHLQQQWGEEWEEKYKELIKFLEEYDISLGCECVSSALGMHGQLPVQDHIVVNAVIDRKSMASYSPFMLLHLERRFRLLTSGFYIFRNGATFDSIYHQYRTDHRARYQQIHEALCQQADAFHESFYEKWQGSLLEGFVCYFVTPESVDDDDLALLSQSSAPSPDKAVSQGLLAPLSQVIIADEEGDDEEMGGAKVDALAEGDAVFPLLQKLLPGLYSYERLSKAEAAAFLERMSPDGSESTHQFQKILSLLDTLKIKRELKISKIKKFSDTYVACLHVLADESFIKYDALRVDSPDNPALLRGNFWVLRTDRPIPTPLTTDEFGEIMKRYLRCGPIPGTIWKFKLVSYTSRTFLFRTASIQFLQSSNTTKFDKQILSYMSSFSVPRDVAEELYSRLEHWKRYITELRPEERNELAHNYLKYYDRFESLPPAPERTRLFGVFLVVSASPELKSVADALSRQFCDSNAARPSADMKDVTLWENQGIVVYSDIMDPSLTKMVKQGFEKAGVKRATVVALDLTIEAYAAVVPDARQEQIKRFGGTVKSFLQSVATKYDLVEINREDPSVSASEWAAIVPTLAPFQQAVENAKKKREIPLTPLNAVLFVTCPGIGKNAILETLFSIPNFEEVMGLAKGSCIQLERDSLQEAWNSTLEKAVANLSISTIFLNRNAPNNSWQSIVVDLEQKAKRFCRKVSYIAVVPNTIPHAPDPANFFSFSDIIVCYCGVAFREQHPMKLCGNAPAIEDVFSLFIHLFGGDRELFMQSIQSQLSPNILPLNVFREDLTEYEKSVINALVPSIQEILHENFKEATSEYKMQFQQKVRTNFTQDRVAVVKALRRPLANIVAELAHQFRELQGRLVDAPIPSSGYLAVKLPLAQVREIVANAEEKYPDKLKQLGVKDEVHVTLWHSSDESSEAAAQPTPPAPPPALAALSGREVVCRIVGIVEDAKARALIVERIALFEDRSTLVPVFNRQPHITLWKESGVKAVYSNELIQRVQHLPLDPVEIVGVIELRK